MHTANGVPARKRDGSRRFNDSEVGFILSKRKKQIKLTLFTKLNVVYLSNLITEI